MFLVFNKDKIYTYGISIVTVILLFCVASIMLPNNKSTVMASAGTGKLLPIYKVGTEEKKISLTLNCAWNDSDIDSILETLKENNCKVTFFMVGDWVQKYPEAAKKSKRSRTWNRNSFKYTSTCKSIKLWTKFRGNQTKCKNYKGNNRGRGQTI